MAKVSVLIAAYNAEEYLEKCLESIINQSFRDIEVIVVDDGSLDCTWNVCKKYSSTDSRVKAIHQENAGCVAARKKALSLSNGDYVCFVDADDWIGLDRIRDLYTLGLENNVDVVLGSLSNYNEGSVSRNGQYFDVGYYNREKIEKDILPSMLAAKPHFTFGIKPSLCAGTYRRGLLVDSYKKMPEDITLGEDACIMYACILDANSIYISDDTQYYYRLNQQSMTHTWNSREFVQASKLFNYLDELFKRKKWNCGLQFEEYKAYISWIIIRKALTASNTNLKSLPMDIENYLIRNNIVVSLQSIKRKKMPLKRRAIYYLIKHRKWSVLMKLLN